MAACWSSASFPAQKQAIILGHAVPMPVVVQVRPWDTELYAAVAQAAAESGRSLYGDDEFEGFE